MLFICHFSELSEGNVRMMAYQLSLSLPVLISHYLSPHTPCTRHMGLPLLLTFSTYTCPLPGPSHWPFQCPGRLFPHSHTVRGLLRSGLRPVLRPPLTTLWSSGHVTPHSAPWFRIVFVFCLPPLLECLLPKDSDFVLVTGVTSVPDTEQVFSNYPSREWICKRQMDFAAGRLQSANNLTSFFPSL